MRMEKSRELSILVYSCWKNSDMWNIFLTLFNKYWPNCDFKMILLTDYLGDTKYYDRFDEIVVLDSNWHDMVIAGIKKAKTDYVMLFMDDYLICDYIKNDDIMKYLKFAREYDVANIRLMESPTIKAAPYTVDSKFSYYEPGTAYSFSTQVGIWNSEFLTKNIKSNWSAWDFERIGSIQVKDNKHPLLAPLDYTFPYEEGVRRGKWMDNGVRLCKRNNIKLDFEKRPAMTNFELSWIYFKGALLEINPNFIVKIQNLFRKRK